LELYHKKWRFNGRGVVYRVAQAYNRAQYLDQRKELMRWWGEWPHKRKL